MREPLDLLDMQEEGDKTQQITLRKCRIIQILMVKWWKTEHVAFYFCNDCTSDDNSPVERRDRNNVGSAGLGDMSSIMSTHKSGRLVPVSMPIMIRIMAFARMQDPRSRGEVSRSGRV